MTSPKALAGTDGFDVALIHGDVWRQHEANEMVNILKTLKTTITQNETRKVQGNLTNKVVGTTNDTRVGVHHQQNVSPRFEIYTHTLTQNHHEKTAISQPTSIFDKTHISFRGNSLAFSAVGSDFSARGTSTSMTVLDASHRSISVEMKAFVAKKESFAIKDLDLGMHFGGALTEIKALKLKAASLHLKSIGANLCSGIAANLNSPFG